MLKKTKRIVYRTRKEHLYHPETGAYTIYGIVACRRLHRKALDYLSDVEPERRRAKKIAAFLNQYDIDTENFREVIDDIRDDDTVL